MVVRDLLLWFARLLLRRAHIKSRSLVGQKTASPACRLAGAARDLPCLVFSAYHAKRDPSDGDRPRDDNGLGGRRDLAGTFAGHGMPRPYERRKAGIA